MWVKVKMLDKDGSLVKTKKPESNYQFQLPNPDPIATLSVKNS
jgi:hypothetical protein